MIAKEISELLARRAEDVSSMLLPTGKRRGNEWCVGSIDGEQGSSLKVHLKGAKAGVWCDFATGEAGDLLDLWASKNNQSILEAIKDCRQYLGLRDLPTLHTPMAKNSITKKPNKKFPALAPESSAFNYLISQRKITSETLAAFKVQQNGNDIVFPYYIEHEIIFLKYLKVEREDGKKKMWTEANCDPVLFGWQALPKNARRITLCEGEIDAMSLREYGIFALSVPFGGGTGRKHEWIENEFKRLEVFDEIYLCLDNDHEGQTATKEIIERLGAHRCLVVELPFKDANECLQKNISQHEIDAAFKNAVTLDPEELKDALTFEQDAWQYANPKPDDFVGYIPLWEKAHDKIRFRVNELNIWSGMNGHGKTQFLGQILLQMIKQGARVCIASLEFKPGALLHRMVRQATARKDCSREYHQAVFRWFHKRLWLFDLQGTAKAKRLMEVFSYARSRYGIDVFIIDSFTTLDFAEDDYKGQKAFVEQLRDFKNHNSCQVHMVAHPRKGADETQIIGKYDIRGTAAVSDLADNCFSVWRNKAKEELVDKLKRNECLSEKELANLEMPDCILRCDKQRHGSWEGKLGFWFHEPSLQYLESSNRKPKPYLDFSILNKNLAEEGEMF